MQKMKGALQEKQIEFGQERTMNMNKYQEMLGKRSYKSHRQKNSANY